MRRIMIAIVTCFGLAACGGGGLRDLSSGSNGPDEFSVLPSKQLVIPQSFAALPTPTPGGANPADPNPVGDAIAILGGNQNVLGAGGVPAGDAALVAQVSRYGVSEGIRSTLATEDAAFRGRRSAFRITGGDRYFKAYSGQALDAYATLDRFRAAGVTVPSAPPAP